jgi:hypothetical protein
LKRKRQQSTVDKIHGCLTSVRVDLASEFLPSSARARATSQRLNEPRCDPHLLARHFCNTAAHLTKWYQANGCKQVTFRSWVDPATSQLAIEPGLVAGPQTTTVFRAASRVGSRKGPRRVGDAVSSGPSGNLPSPRDAGRGGFHQPHLCAACSRSAASEGIARYGPLASL